MRLFSPVEASRTLPLVSKIVSDSLSTGQKARSILDEFGDCAEFKIKSKKLDNLFEELQAIGCEYKDWNYEIGLIHFPSIINDQKVYLCWRSDEPELLYYHGVYEGYSGRKRIPEHLLET